MAPPGTFATQFRARRLALKRRLALGLRGRFEPYPTPPGDLGLSPSRAHYADFAEAKLALSWARAGIADPAAWQSAARAKLVELSGYRRREVRPEARHVRASRLDQRLRRRVHYLRLDPHSDVPVNLIWSDGESPAPRPVMLCLHGHNSGAHLSWGAALMPADPIKLGEGADYARQAASNGYLAVCIEQAGFGERREREMTRRGAAPCVDASHHALLLGRTLLGERASDVSSVIDWLEDGGAGMEIDQARIHAMGNSTGGDIAVHAAAMDARITGVIASGCVGRLRETTARHHACPDAIIPGILEWLEYDDILALCAPRPILAVSGVRDHIYPYAELVRTVDGARAVYRALGADDKLRAAAGPAGHRFYPDVAWPLFLDMVAATGGGS